MKEMTIGRNNYESFFIDYFDGRLDAVETAELMLFLEHHPDLRSLFESYESVILKSPSHIAFDGKDEIRKNIIPEGGLITEDNFDQVFVDSVENELGYDMEARLQHFLSNNPFLERDYDLLQKTRLPVPAITYPDKAGLKKSIKIPLYRRIVSAASAAAVIALLFITLTYFIKDRQEMDTAAVAVRMMKHDHSDGRAVSDGNLSRGIIPRQKQDFAVMPVKNNTERDNNLAVGDVQANDRGLDRMVPAGQLAFIPVASKGISERITAYKTSYTEILANVEIRQLIKKEDEPGPMITGTMMQNTMNRIYKAAGSETERPADSPIGLWDLANISVAGYNALTNDDVKLNRKTDADGRTTAFALGRMEFNLRK